MRLKKSNKGKNVNNIDFDLKKALHYDDLARKAVFGYDQLYTMVLSLLTCEINENADILVVGCGTGMEITTFGKLMPNWKLTGVDPSEEMIKISKSKVEEYKLNNRVTLHHGLVEDMPEGKMFDAVIIIFVMRFISDEVKKLSLLKDIDKRTRAGARLIIVDQYGEPSRNSFQLLFKGWEKFMKLRGVSSELITKISTQAINKSFFTEYELKILLSEVGFEKTTQFYNSFIHGGWIAQKKDIDKEEK